jgi:hypothetical protein
VADNFGPVMLGSSSPVTLWPVEAWKQPGSDEHKTQPTTRMKNTRHIKTVLLALAIGGSTLAISSAEEEEKDVIVPFPQLPLEVQKTIQSQVTANNATLGEVKQEQWRGKVYYEASLTVAGGKKLEVTVVADGSLYKVKADDEGKEGKKDWDEKDGKEDKD